MMHVPAGWTASWSRNVYASKKSDALGLPQAVETAQFTPSDGGADHVTVELYAASSAVDSIMAMYEAIVQKDAGQSAATRQRFSITSPTGHTFIGYGRGVVAVGGGSVESYELTLFSVGAGSPPLRVAAGISLDSPLVSGASSPQAAAARLLSQLNL
jgi:hypothetical protein